MATIRKGILGGFSGTVGTVVGGKWKQTSYMRGKAPNIHDANTQAQKEQRAKWACVQNYLAPIKDYINTVYCSAPKGQSPLNVVAANLMKYGIKGSYPNYQIYPNYPDPIFYGSLPAATLMSFSSHQQQGDFSWGNPRGNGDAQDDDLAYPLAYNVTKGIALYPSGTVKRRDCRYVVPIPLSWAHDTVDIYFGFTSADHKRNSTVVQIYHMTDFYIY